MRDELRDLSEAEWARAALVVLAGLLAVSLGASLVPLPAASLLTTLLLAVLVAASAVVEARVGRVEVVGQARTDLTAVWVLVAAVTAGPLAVAAVAVTGSLALAAVEPTRRSPLHVALHAATYALAGTLASAVFVLVLNAHGPSSTRVTVVGMLAAAVAQTLVAVTVVADLVGPRPVPQDSRAPGRGPLRGVDWAAEAALACVALLLALAVAADPALAVLALPPVVLLQRGLLFRQMLRASRSDPKTGLLNHTAWLSLAGRLLARGGRASVLLLDLDHFKEVNDEHGHLVGDQVLVAVADALAAALRPGDLLGRFGGEEFAVLLPQTDRATAASVGERLRQAVAACEVLTPAGPLRATASVGAVTTDAGAGPDSLLTAADAALYAAKRAGRDRLVQSPDLELDPAPPVGAEAYPVPPVRRCAPSAGAS